MKAKIARWIGVAIAIFGLCLAGSEPVDPQAGLSYIWVNLAGLAMFLGPCILVIIKQKKDVSGPDR